MAGCSQGRAGSDAQRRAVIAAPCRRGHRLIDCRSVSLDRQTISALAHADHPIAAPIDDPSVERLLAALPAPDGGKVADIGCGTGQWLVRLLTPRTRLRGIGVDLSRHGLAAARLAAEA